MGRIGILQSVEKHQGSYDIVHVKDIKGQAFSTRISNVIVIGDGKSPAISLPRGEGIKLSLMEERAGRVHEDEGVDDEEAEEDD